LNGTGRPSRLSILKKLDLDIVSYIIVF